MILVLTLAASACTAASADAPAVIADLAEDDAGSGTDGPVGRSIRADSTDSSDRTEDGAAMADESATAEVSGQSAPQPDAPPADAADDGAGPAPRVASGGAGRGMGRQVASDGTPTFDGDFADPDLLHHDGTYYAYATNTMFINVPVLSASPGERSRLVGDALPDLPAWSEPHHVWAPSVTSVGETFVLHYATRHAASGRQCISVAVADDPAGPFVDESDGPLVCPLDQGGAIDPSVVADGDDLWLLWKSDGNCCGLPTVIFAQPLGADGTTLDGAATELIRNDRSWERDVVEAPSMIEVDGRWHLFYSANRWDTTAYAVGHAVCESVIGPCVKDAEPWLTSTAATSGPGGLEVIELPDLPRDVVVYHGWTGDQVGYPDGARALYARLLRWVDGRPVLVGD